MYLKTFVSAAVAAGLSLVACAFAAAQTTPASMPAEASSGVTVRFESAAPSASKPALIEIRPSRLVALYVPHGAVPSVLTAPGPFRATFEGDLNLRLRDLLSFTAFGRGKLTLTINNKPVLEASGDDLSQTASQPIRLNKGKNHLIAVYESPADGDAELRLFWSGRSFRPEPVPPMALSHGDDLTGLHESEQLRAGRFAVAQLRCARCHATPAADAAQGMPELKQDAPSFEDIGRRLQQGWIAAWVNDPHALRPSAHMPRVFTGAKEGEIDPRAADVGAYLASVQSARGIAASPGQADAGGKLFARLNCIGCHTLPGGVADPERVSLKLVKQKFQPAALVAYLEVPQAHYGWNPMPNFRLSATEAADLAAYLTSFDAPQMKAPPGDAKRGQALIASAGCANCHKTLEPSTLKAIALDDLKIDANHPTGCLASDSAARGHAPDFELQDGDRAALQAFLATDHSSLAHDEPSEFSTRQVREMRCIVCHPRDGAEAAVYSALDVEVQALFTKYPPVDPPNEPLAADQHAPLLTWTGEKLRPQWMQAFVAGELTYKPRPFIRARMPGFTARAGLLTAGLTAEHGCAPVLADPPKPDAGVAAIGQKLCGTTPNESFSCVQCHSVAQQPPKAPFEAPSINFALVTSRLRKDYYDRWLHDPLRIDPNTKMPRFDDADGKTGVVDVFDGDSKKQYDAIWDYMLAGRDIQPPPQ